MASYNRVVLIGNLTRDPEVRHVGSNSTAVCELGLAVNRTWFDKAANEKKEEVTFIDVTLWGRQAEVAGEYLAKGRPVLIEGRLHMDQWEDKTTGDKRYKLKVVGETMQMLGSRSDSESGGNRQTQQPRSQPQQQQSRNPGSQQEQKAAQARRDNAASVVADYNNSVPDDEVPF